MTESSDSRTAASPEALDGDAGHTTCVGRHPDLCGTDWADGEVRLQVEGGREAVLPWQQAATGEALRRLLGEGLALAAWDALAAAAPDGGSEAAGLLERLARGRLLAWWYGRPGRRLLVAEPLLGSFMPAPAAAPDPARRLSRKAMLLLARDEPRLVDPLAEAQIVVTAQGLPLLPALAAAGAATPPLPHHPGLPPGLADFLTRCGFLRPAGEESPFAEAWTPAEWLFQRQTGLRSGPRFEAAVTGERQVPPPGPRPAAPPEVRIALPEPSSRASAPLAEVMERRRSLRRPGLRPPSLQQLAGLLWSVARRRADREAGRQDGLVLRNVPGGGALGELEFYLAVNRCEGLQRGFYFYDGQAHALALVAAPGPAFEALLEDAAERLFLEEARPDCVVVLSSRLARLSRKYRGGALRLSLLHVGLTFEALYLAATDLGLSPCAEGFTDQAFFAALTGFDPYEEVGLGQFALSGPPD